MKNTPGLGVCRSGWGLIVWCALCTWDNEFDFATAEVVTLDGAFKSRAAHVFRDEAVFVVTFQDHINAGVAMFKAFKDAHEGWQALVAFVGDADATSGKNFREMLIITVFDHALLTR